MTDTLNVVEPLKFQQGAFVVDKYPNLGISRVRFQAAGGHHNDPVFTGEQCRALQQWLARVTAVNP